MDTAAKKKIPRGKKLAFWIGGGILGLFVLTMSIGAIGVAMQPGGWEAEMTRQAASESQKAADEASKSKSDAEAAQAEVLREEEAKKAAEEKANADAKAAEAEKAKADAESQEAARAAADASQAALAKDEEAKKAAEAKSEADAKAAAEAKAAADAKAKSEADAKAAAEAKTPAQRAVEAANVEGLEVHKETSVVFAQFPIADSLTSGLITTGAQLDTIEILKAVRANIKDYDRVFVQGTFSMVDEFGNSEDSIILNAGFDKATVDKINFDGINSDNIWEIRDAGMVHPELRK